MLPGIEAVVVALADDPAVTEFDEHGEPRPQRLIGGERAGVLANRAGPHYFEGHLIAARDRVDQLETLRLQQRLATCAAFFHRLQVARRAIRQQPVWKLFLHDVRREERVE